MATFVSQIPEVRRSEWVRLRDIADNALLTGNKSDELSLLASLLPSLEAIRAVTTYGELFHFCSTGGSLPLLREVDLAHYDLEGAHDLADLAALFKAAPNLKKLSIHGLSGDDEEPVGDDDRLLQGDTIIMANLREIDIRAAALNASTLDQLLSACPVVEVFRYASGGSAVGYCQFHPGEMRDVMMRRGKQLKRVAVDFMYADNCEEWDGWDANDMDVIREDFRRRGIELEVSNLPSTR
ncbi:hypothetical protein B0H66DRAFT_552414 [Apodospora peruviana]|uniref:Uncharacterized protein n=1 Tax=Apodospora peruviana TaxID=516989 RepID=A0AAE0IAP1_9PEZI|nr:hypothetical protein B0H66DRAFT_552414 [Apodospora peruviana]